MRKNNKMHRSTRKRSQHKALPLTEMLESRVLMTVTVQFSTFNLGNSPEAMTLAVNGWVGVAVTAVSDNGVPVGGFDLDTGNRGIYGNMVQRWPNNNPSPTGAVPTSPAGTVIDVRDSYFSDFSGLGLFTVIPLSEDNNGSSQAPAVNQKTSGDYSFAPLVDAGGTNYGLGTRLRGAGAFSSNPSTSVRIAFLVVPAGSNVQVIGQFTDRTSSTLFNVNQTFLVPTASNTVGNKQLFYNNSALDGNDPAANAADDNAIALDKTALPAGGTASFANVSSYSKGINGIMVDMTALTGTVTAADFTFKVGGASPSDTNPANWAAAPAPTSVVARPGAGMGGSTRVELIWADNAIQKQWLQVVVKANANTGLTADTAFYFGNAIGETGDSTANFHVTAVDEITARAGAADLTGQPNATAVLNALDFNRDKLVNAADAAIAGANNTFFLNSLQKLTAPASPALESVFFTGTLGTLDQPSTPPATPLITGPIIPTGPTTTTLATSSIVPAAGVSLGNLTTITPSVVPPPKKIPAPASTRLVPQSAKPAHKIASGLKKFIHFFIR